MRHGGATLATRVCAGKIRVDGLDIECVGPNSAVQLVVAMPASRKKGIQVTLMDGRNLALEVEAGDTIASIKQKLVEKGTPPAAQQRLVFAGSELKDASTVGSYNIPQDAVMRLVLTLQGGGAFTIKVKTPMTPSQAPFDVVVQPGETVAAVKAKITAARPDIPPAQQKLVFNGKLLDDAAVVPNASAPGPMDIQGLEADSTLTLVVSLPTNKKRWVEASPLLPRPTPPHFPVLTQTHTAHALAAGSS